MCCMRHTDAAGDDDGLVLLPTSGSGRRLQLGGWGCHAWHGIPLTPLYAATKLSQAACALLLPLSSVDARAPIIKLRTAILFAQLRALTQGGLNANLSTAGAPSLTPQLPLGGIISGCKMQMRKMWNRTTNEWSCGTEQRTCLAPVRTWRR